MTMSIMIQGTGSNIGKSMLVAGLTRALTMRGLDVSPFKPQNMSNNAAVTSDGGEIGRAQALQALAAGKKPHTDMNPVLLKPESSTGSQVVVHGQRLTTVKAREYAKLKPQLIKPVMESFNRLTQLSDIVIVEGAGSPAEVNLRDGDIANMGFAQAANVPVILAGDIDRGGVIAQIVGTQQILSSSDRDLIKGFLINKFRGDPTLFDDGYDLIKERTSWTGLGVIPWFDQAALLPAEDSLDIKSSPQGNLKIIVTQLPRIANFDDLDPLKAEPDVEIIMLKAGQAIPGDADLIIIPGSKSTIADLKFLRSQGWDTDIYAHVNRGGSVLGICGGYQMLGNSISDPDGIEGEPEFIEGLGLLNVNTRLTPEKTLTEVEGTASPHHLPISGYEIHIGETDGPDTENSWLTIENLRHGAQNESGQVRGTYVHGIFSSDPFRRSFLQAFGADASELTYSTTVERTLDQLAHHFEEYLDIDACLRIARNGI